MSLTSQGPQWSSVVAYAGPRGAPVELQPALLPRRWEAAEVRAAPPPFRTVLGDGTLPSSLHPPPDPQRSSSQRERVWKQLKENVEGAEIVSSEKNSTVLFRLVILYIFFNIYIFANKSHEKTKTITQFAE